MDLFSAKEVLSKEDAWYCSQCKTHRQATKQLQVFHAPEILIIHLKRFLQVNRGRREKQTSMVDFPLQGFDLTPYIPAHALDNEPPPIYDLYAISVSLVFAPARCTLSAWMRYDATLPTRCPRVLIRI
jgi:ubiquitin C-terminal hydrolase